MPGSPALDVARKKCSCGTSCSPSAFIVHNLRSGSPVTSGLEAGAGVTLGCRASDGKVGQTYLIYFMDTPNSLQVSTRRSCLYRNHMRP